MNQTNNITDSQLNAITFEGKNILVSASAGSGKTFVMIERVINLILNGKTDADRILCVTYTEAAAQEMKQKIIKAVINEINNGNDKDKFRKTLSLIPSSSISTFHSFCANLLRSYFYSANVEPLFKIIDESDATKFQTEAIDNVFASLYESEDEDFLYLVRIFRMSRGDDNLKEIVKTLAEFCFSEAEPEDFLLKTVTAPSEEKYLTARQGLISYIRLKLRALLSQAEYVLQEYETYGVEKYILHAREVKTLIEGALQSSDENLYSIISLSFSTFPTVKNLDAEIFEPLKKTITDVKTKFKELAVFYAEFLSNENGLNEYLSTTRQNGGIVNLTLAYMREYARIKKQEGVLDFSDLEHLTYNMLKNDETVRNSVKEKYEYIFADEYQDVNGVQEEILNMISKDNAFFVGDVKQSIYAFRGCNPKIFVNKYDLFEKGFGKAISLDDNFRCSEGVLNSVNSVFKDVFTKEFGDVDYKSNPMIFGKLYPENCGDTILHIIDNKANREQSPTEKYDIQKECEKEVDGEYFKEGVAIANIVFEELKQDFYDLSEKKFRKVRPGDIAILTRSSKSFPSEIVKQLSKLGIPVSFESKNSIVDYPEIQLLISILKVTAFFYDDVPFCAVLKSPVGNVTEEELALIRSNYLKRFGKKIPFLQCVKNYSESGENIILKRKLVEFFNYIDKIRLLSEVKSVSELLSTVIKDKNLDLFFLTLPLGEVRLKRVERFLALDGGNSKLSIVEFLNKLDAIKDSVTLSEVSGDDTVKVMTMHSSKGLEFPIVILAGLDKRFNDSDTKDNILKIRDKGIATKFYDELTMTSDSTVVREYFKTLINFATVQEEARLLYVAMTRAKFRLHLVTSKPPKPYRTTESVMFANCFSDFLKMGDMKIVTTSSDITDILTPTSLNPTNLIIGKPDGNLSNKILQNLNFRYGDELSTVLPLKTTVTQINGEETHCLYPDKDGDEEEFKTDINYTERGTAYHRFLELCDFLKDNSRLEAERFKDKLTEEQFNYLDFNLLDKILALPVFKALKDYTLYREQPFISSLTVNEIYGKDSQEKILVQGAMDLLAVKGDTAIIVDYKMSGKSQKDLTATYKKQLELYSLAVKKALNVKTVKTFILKLKTAEIFEIL